MSNNLQSKQHMLEKCRKHYHKNIKQLEKINLFEQTYKSTETGAALYGSQKIFYFLNIGFYVIALMLNGLIFLKS